jgi:sec-independent protein translocase protein TatA
LDSVLNMRVLPPDFAILDIGGTEILIIMMITLLLFGSERLPGLARSLGKSIREFKKATSGLEEELKRALEEPPISRHQPVAMSFPPAAPKPAATPPADTTLPASLPSTPDSSPAGVHLPVDGGSGVLPDVTQGSPPAFPPIGNCTPPPADPAKPAEPPQPAGGSPYPDL